MTPSELDARLSPEIERRVDIGGLRLCVRDHGDPDDPAIVLIMGLAAQLTEWPDAFVEHLVRGGRRVVRFDNRDIGLSDGFDHVGKLRPLLPELLKASFGMRVDAPYCLEDMAADVVGLLDALAVAEADVVGLSMGGMIGQVLAARYPRRVKTFTAMMTSTNHPTLPRSTPKAMLALLGVGADLRGEEGIVRHGVRTRRILGGDAWPVEPEALEVHVRRTYARSYRPRGVARQLRAVMASGSLRRYSRAIRKPTLVLHGEADPLVPVAAGRDIAKHVPGARMRTLPGMGHTLPAELLPILAGEILSHTRR
jgi:pimeloyl-ACP methyl ester carboxylesterase